MISIRHHWILLLCAVGTFASRVHAQGTPIARSAPRSVIASTPTRSIALTPSEPSTVLGQPIASIGRPVPFTAPRMETVHAPKPTVVHRPESIARPRPASLPSLGIRRVSHEEPKSGPVFPKYVIRAQSPSTSYQPIGGPPPVPPPSSDNPEYFGPVPPDSYNPDVRIDQPVRPNFWDKCCGWFKGLGRPFAGSDWMRGCGCDTGLISPVTNPFFFEDPRAVTELRPIVIYQFASDGNPIMRGGDSEFFGLQARIALGESFSIVMNKLGFVALQPDSSGLGFDDEFGFAEVNLGAKWTFLRNDEVGRYAAAGLNFQIPVGSSSVFQDTGDLGLDPYFSFAQRFGRSSFGEFNFVGNAGYSFSTSDARSEFFHTSFHLSYDIARLQKFYPLVEMNWFHFTKFGTSNAFAFEGSDIVNFGSSMVPNRDLLTIATGFRYKFTDTTQFGLGAEWTLTNEDNALRDFRLTFDIIFRY